MANQQVVNQWRAVIDQYRANLATLVTSRDRLQPAYNQAQETLTLARTRYSVALQSGNTVEIETANQTVANAEKDVRVLLSEISRLSADIQQTTADISNAESQLRISERGTENTNSNTPPQAFSVPQVWAEYNANANVSLSLISSSVQQASNVVPIPSDPVPVGIPAQSVISNSSIFTNTTVPDITPNVSVPDISFPTVSTPQSQPVASGVNQARDSGQQRVDITASTNPPDWRFKISLSQSDTVKYLYRAQNAGILQPLVTTGGVLFPYTPQITVNYMANYESPDLPHTNYRFYNYKNSAVDNITITGDFTAQDTSEANYLLAVIHFFRSVTKMFYGQDQNAGVPPPLCYLTGFGTYAFNNHPVAITTFQLTYPNDVDYINARITYSPGTNPFKKFARPDIDRTSIWNRLRGLNFGGSKTTQNQEQGQNLLTNTTNWNSVTRVPTKMTITVNAIPMMSRWSISNRFSFEQYARGDLLLGKSSGSANQAQNPPNQSNPKGMW